MKAHTYTPVAARFRPPPCLSGVELLEDGMPCWSTGLEAAAALQDGISWLRRALLRLPALGGGLLFEPLAPFFPEDFEAPLAVAGDCLGAACWLRGVERPESVCRLPDLLLILPALVVRGSFTVARPFLG